MKKSTRFTVGLFLGIFAFPSFVHAQTILITEQEASLPSEQIATSDRGITRGPRLDLVRPTDGETTRSPLHFTIRFRAFGGSKINIGSLHITYLKTPEVDLLPRVTQFVRSDGIDISDAIAPPGDHFLRVAISDTDGRTRTSVFEFKVLP